MDGASDDGVKRWVELPAGLSGLRSTVGIISEHVASHAKSLQTIAGKTTGKFKAFVGFDEEEDEVDEFGNPLSTAEKIIRRKQTELLLSTQEELISQTPNKALSQLIEGIKPSELTHV